MKMPLLYLLYYIMVREHNILIVSKIEGLKSMKRQYVHLTDDVDLATEVGSRHGVPVIIAIRYSSTTRQRLEILQDRKRRMAYQGYPC